MATKKQMAEAARKVLDDFYLMYEEYRRIQYGKGYKWKYEPFQRFPSIVELSRMIQQVK